MDISVIGTGYVGLVVGACLAETGHDVTCADIVESKIARLKQGEILIYEPGLEPMVKHNLEAGRLRFTTDVAEAVREGEIIFIAVGTPPGEDGSADLQHVLAVATTIGQAMNGEKIVITKSTVPVGTAAKVRQAIAVNAKHPFHVCSNPEFLKEGAAVEDFMKPDRVVLGVDDPKAAEVLRTLFEPFVRTGHNILIMDVASAEITKYAANAMLATRISFMNAIARLCSAAGADVDQVRMGIGSDSRIGPSFLFPGVGYGGSCFPKDVKALIRTSHQLGLDASILEAVESVNDSQKRLLLDGVVKRFGDDLSGRRFAVWGLAFKPNTDDMRDAPSLVTIEGLLERGARVVAHDPVAIEEARHRLGDRIEFQEQNYAALEGADALVIHTEWHPYRRPDFPRMKELLLHPVIFDGRNLYKREMMEAHGFEYYSIGKQPVIPSRGCGVRILITGAAGFLGSHLVDRFLANGHHVIGIDNFITGNPDNVAHLKGRPDFQLIEQDVTKFISVEGPLDGVLHFASPASPVDYLELPIQTLKVGSLGTHNALGLAKAKGARFLLASTSEVYGDPLVHPQPETYWGNVNPVGPRGVYDEAKRFAEAITMAYHRYHAVETRIVRIFNTYGPRMRPADGRVVSNFIVQALRGEPLTLYGDGSQTRSFCFVEDEVEGIYRLFNSDRVDPTNIGNPDEFTVRELAELVLKQTGSKSKIVSLPLPTDDPKVRQPDSTVARQVLGWEPKVRLAEGIERTIPFFKALVEKGAGARTLTDPGAR